MAVRRKPAQRQSCRRSAIEQLTLGQAGQGQQKVDPAVRAGHGQTVDPAQRLQQGGPPRGVEISHAPQVAGVKAAVEKAGHHRLLVARDRGLLPAVEGLPAREQSLRQDHVGQTDRRGQAPGEGPRVNDPPVPVHSLHRGDRAAAVAEFAVIVVLDDPAAARHSPVQQPRPPRGGHRDAHRELVRGRQIGHGRPAGGQCIGVHAGFVHRNVSDGLPAGQQGALHGGITGVFHRVNRLRAQKRDELAHQGLHPGAHHHLIRPAANAPVFREQNSQSVPQPCFPLGISPLQKLRGVIDDLFIELGPGGVGEGGNVHGGRGKKLCGDGLRSCTRAAGDRRLAGQSNIVGNVVAAPGPGDHVALGQKQLVGSLCRGTAYAQTGAELPLGGQLFSVLQSAVPDRPGHGAVELLIHRRASLGIKRQGE